MNKYIIALPLYGLLLFTSCKKETVVEQTVTVQPDGSTKTTTRTTTDYDLRLQKAEKDYQNAERDRELARERGDDKAERIAKEASDKAKEAWEQTKAALKEVGEDTKDAYNRTLEKAKAK